MLLLITFENLIIYFYSSDKLRVWTAWFTLFYKSELFIELWDSKVVDFKSFNWVGAVIKVEPEIFVK